MRKDNNLSKLEKLIKANRRFLITSHINPEPDALGAELAFAALLKKFGKQVTIINSQKLPARYKFMPHSKEIDEIGQANTDFDVAVILDCSDLNRIGKVQALLNEDIITINIDHHISNTRFANLNIVDLQASSVCEIIYRIFRSFNSRLDKDVAMNLYCGILTDTGSFHYSNASSRTFEVASELVNFGLDVNRIYRQVYRIDNLNHVKLIGRFLQQAKTFFEGKVLYLEFGKNLNVGESIARDLAEQALNILRLLSGAKVFVLLRKSTDSNYLRLNLRSNCNIDVNRIARTFNGGGHKRAASATIKGDLYSVKRAVLKEIRRYLS